MMWMDGEIRADTAVSFDLRDRGLLLSDGLFETILVAGGMPFRFDAHRERLRTGAAVLRLAVDMTVVTRAVADLAASLAGPGAIRVTVTRGVGPRGLAIPAEQTPRVFATAAPWSPTAAFRPVHLRLSPIRRNDTSPLSRVKSLAYLDNILALDAATKAGGDDALLLSTRERIACTAVANIFALQGTRLMTPPIGDGVLPGTMRALMLALAPSCGLEPEERSLALADLWQADAVFTTNSLRLMARALSLDGDALGQAGDAAFARLCRALSDTLARECGWKPPFATMPA